MENLKAGRELDALVAEKVMGARAAYDVASDIWRIQWSEILKGRDTQLEQWAVNDILPHYSTDIAAAWEVVEYIKERPPCEAKEMGATFTISDEVGGWWAGWTWHEWTGDGALADTAPLAICLAALKAVGAL